MSNIIDRKYTQMGQSKMSRGITVKLFGVFRKAYGNSQMSLEATKKKETLGNIIQKAVESSPELRHLLIDPELNDPRPNAVILVNGKEIGILKGLETEVGESDEIVIIPVTHGG